MEKIYSVDLSEINVSSLNVRTKDRDTGVEELAQSIERYGLLQPVVLMGTHGKPPYELIVGQRRYLAHKHLHKKQILCTFVSILDPLQAKILSLTENMHRVELNHADKAQAITEMYRQFDNNERRVADELDLPLRTVRDYIKIEVRATNKAKELLRKGRVKKADVKRVIEAAQGDDKKADALLDEIAKLSKYEKSRAVDYGRRNPDAKADKIIEAAKTPRIQRTIIVNLTTALDEALNAAENQLSLDREAIASKALSEWLQGNGFLTN